jgi:NAD(P)-dependent dehydrogenase (short-subunit alcohol dehydrogenase family)
LITLKGKTCVVTGAASGIGERTSLLFESLGAHVLALDVDAERGKRLESTSKDGRIEFREIDLTNRAQVLEFGRWSEDNVERIDVLVSNAVAHTRNSVLDASISDWDSEVALSLTAPFLLSRFAAKKMIAKGIHGKIIIISAVQAWFPMSSSFTYSVAKGGLISMVKSLAVDLGQHGICVTAVMPGPIYTHEKDGPEVAPESLDNQAATLLGRMGRKTEVANLLAFLASDLNTFMTGNTILIDGGRSISRKPDPEELSQLFLKSEHDSARPCSS